MMMLADAEKEGEMNRGRLGWTRHLVRVDR
jgi:hypothetical protein